MKRYVAFLRGINVSGHHKVPMAELRKEMETLNCKKVITILNSGNIIFDSMIDDIEYLEKLISEHLEKTFGFSVPTILRKSEDIYSLWNNDPFKDVLLTSDIRWYASFLWKDVAIDLKLPWANEDNSYRIIDKSDKTILSVLDLSLSKSTKGMQILEKHFGKNITTRNWNTIKRVAKKLDATH